MMFPIPLTMPSWQKNLPLEEKRRIVMRPASRPRRRLLSINYVKRVRDPLKRIRMKGLNWISIVRVMKVTMVVSLKPITTLIDCKN